MGNQQNQRIRKFNKLLITGKLLISFYLIMFVTAHITSNTGAYFTDAEKRTHNIQAGTWWDGSELEFVENTIQITGEQSKQQSVEVTLQNNGMVMIGSTTYHILYSNEGDPQKGDVVKKGKISSLEAGEELTLSHDISDEGSYMFKVMQREGYQSNHDESGERFSETAVLKSPVEKELNEESNNEQEPQNEEDNKEQEPQNEESNSEQEPQSEREDNKISSNKHESSDRDQQQSEQQQQETDSKEKTDDEVSRESKTTETKGQGTKQDTEAKQDAEMNTLDSTAKSAK